MHIEIGYHKNRKKNGLPKFLRKEEQRSIPKSYLRWWRVMGCCFVGVVWENEDFFADVLNLYTPRKNICLLTDKTFHICHCSGLRMRYFVLDLDFWLFNVSTVHLCIFYIVAYFIWPRIIWCTSHVFCPSNSPPVFLYYHNKTHLALKLCQLSPSPHCVSSSCLQT